MTNSTAITIAIAFIASGLIVAMMSEEWNIRRTSPAFDSIALNIHEQQR